LERDFIRQLSRIACGWNGISSRAVTQNRVLLRLKGMITATGVMDNESVYRNYSEELTRYATGLVGPFDAPDVVTDACLKAFDARSWPDVVDRRAYLYRTVLTVANDHHRRTLSRRVREMKSATPDLVPDPTASIDVEVLEAVSRLSVQQRAAVFLTYWEDLAPEAAAARMGFSVGSVKRQLARARKRLGEVLS
jgi:RNA polymerase sigma-70 factor (ECF subfamily)